MINMQTDMPLHLFHHGENFNAYELFGAHKAVQNGKRGYIFRVFAPRAKSVSVIAFEVSYDFLLPSLCRDGWKLG